MLGVKMQLLAQGLKQNDIAKKAGVNKSYISNVLAERDKASNKVIEAFRSFGIEIGRDKK